MSCKRANIIVVTCSNCDKEFEKPEYLFKRNPVKHFCSHSCKVIAQQTGKLKTRNNATLVSFICDYCKQEHIKTSREGHLNKHFKNRFCSIECKQNWQKDNPEQSTNWKGGTSALSILIRNREHYKTWRIEVFRRDKYTCKKCNTIGGKLEAHHIIPINVQLKNLIDLDVKSIEESTLFNNISNGDTLCKTCHKEFHGIYGKINYSIDQYNEWNSQKGMFGL